MVVGKLSGNANFLVELIPKSCLVCFALPFVRQPIHPYGNQPTKKPHRLEALSSRLRSMGMFWETVGSPSGLGKVHPLTPPASSQSFARLSLLSCVYSTLTRDQERARLGPGSASVWFCACERVKARKLILL